MHCVFGEGFKEWGNSKNLSEDYLGGRTVDSQWGYDEQGSRAARMDLWFGLDWMWPDMLKSGSGFISICYSLRVALSHVGVL